MTTVFTYGVFDILHPGHIKLLENAKGFGDKLVVGIVMDEAVKNKKGENRPILNQDDRLFLIKSLKCVDNVFFIKAFDPTHELTEMGLMPDLLIKGDDWDYIPGTEYVESYGGQLIKLPYSKQWSTTKIIERIQNVSNIE